MNIQFTAGKFMALDNNGAPYVGAKIWPYLAGTSTPGTSYSDPDCTAANTWPVVLNARGEASIYVNVGTDFYLTLPTATDISSPIWESQKVGVQQGVVIDKADATLGTTNNNYAAATIPPYRSIPSDFLLVMTPDVDSQVTYGATTFTGSGINDISITGPYVGTTPGSIFSVEIETVYVQAPIAPTAVLSGTGVITAGNHYVKLTALTATGETDLGQVSGVVAADGSHEIDVSGIPATAGPITGYKIYMTKAGGTTYYYVDTTTSTTYSINVADAGLTVVAPTTNTTGDGAGHDTVKWKKDGGAYTTGVSLTALPQSMMEGMYFQSFLSG